MKSVELKNKIIAMLYQNMSKLDAMDTLAMIEEYSGEIPLEDIDISIRGLNVLKSCGFYTVESLRGKTVEDLYTFKNMTKKVVEESIELKLIKI
jgi:DNA-directed RNA polymerase alpha subunit